MKRIISAIIVAAALTAVAQGAAAQDFEFRVKAGFNLGGTSPLPLPREIRAIKGYSPNLSLSIGADVVRHINPRWAVMSGLMLETKGMTARAHVRNYGISMMISDGDSQGNVQGVFTGGVKTKVDNDYLTLPLAAVYKFNDRWAVNAGMFVSVLLDGNFTGAANDGYIRDGDPTGEKIGVTSATYDFSGDIRRINWGGRAGAIWRAYRHFSVYGDLSWAANSIFKRDFTGISFDMYNVYFNVGFAYTF